MKKTKIILMIAAIVIVIALMTACLPQTVASIDDSGVTLGGNTATQIIANLCAAALRVALLVIAAVIAKVGLPYLEKKGLMWLVRTFVRSAEKQGETGRIAKEKKKEFVLNLLKTFGVQSSPLVDNMIEAAVEELDAFGTQVASMIDNYNEPPDGKE